MFWWIRNLFKFGSITVFAILLLTTRAAIANDPKPIKIGFSMALSGAVAPNGRQLLIALEIWRDDVNAKGGLLGRPVELVYYDDQSNPSNVPGIYTKLISVDKVDLLLGPYATNMVVPAMPVIMSNQMTTISMLAIGVNRHFSYERYFSMVPVGSQGIRAFSLGFFELAAEQKPRPLTVAILAADAEFARTAADGARENAKALGFNVVFDRTYPPTTTDHTSVVRALQAAKPDIVFVASYPPDTVGVVRAANEVGLIPQMIGGTMIGLQATPIKQALGPLANGLITMESFLPASGLKGPGLDEFLRKYSERAAGQKIDPLGYGIAPFGYAAGQVLAQAVSATASLNHGQIAKYIRSNTHNTIVGPISYNNDGDWSESRTLYTQFQNVRSGDIEQFRDATNQVILWPLKYKNGSIIFPFENARK